MTSWGLIRCLKYKWQLLQILAKFSAERIVLQI